MSPTKVIKQGSSKIRAHKAHGLVKMTESFNLATSIPTEQDGLQNQIRQQSGSSMKENYQQRLSVAHKAGLISSKELFTKLK
mmetsp:Transcript_29324/g.44173  ORF Transcript_29324/g.44173 Transcript_29324/m.44173 type:complete len:82 (+) Transcript_29324:613-858(+)